MFVASISSATNWAAVKTGLDWERTEIGVKGAEKDAVHMLANLGSEFANGNTLKYGIALNQDPNEGGEEEEGEEEEETIQNKDLNSDIGNYLKLRSTDNWSRIFGLEPIPEPSTKTKKKVGKAGSGGGKVQKAGKMNAEDLKKGNTDNLDAKNMKSFIDVTGLRLKDGVLGKSKKNKENAEKTWKFINTVPGPVKATIEWKVAEILFILKEVGDSVSSIDKGWIYSLYFGIAKFITRLREIEVRDLNTTNYGPVNPQLIADLENVYGNFKFAIAIQKLSPVEIDTLTWNEIIENSATRIMIEVSNKYPRLFLDTPFDRILPDMAMKPYPSQVKLMEYMLGDDGVMLFLASAMGEGKTSSIVSGAKYFARKPTNVISSDRKHRKEYVIYTCPSTLLHVMEAAINCLHEAKIPRADAYMETLSTGEKKLVIKDTWSCKQTIGRGNRRRTINTPPVVLVTDIECTIEILRRNREAKEIINALRSKMITESDLTQKQRDSLPEMRIEATKDYCVIFDEPTAAGLDQENPKIINIIKDTLVEPNTVEIESANVEIADTVTSQLDDDATHVAVNPVFTVNPAVVDPVVVDPIVVDPVIVDPVVVNPVVVDPAAIEIIQQNEIVKVIKELLLNPPKWLVFSCATLPDISKVPEITDLYKLFYPDARIGTIKPGDIRIGSEVSTMDGQVYVPYNGITTREQLIKLIGILKENRLFQKMFTCETVHRMFERLAQHGIEIPQELEFGYYMNQTQNLKQQAIQDLAIKYLELLYDASETLVEANDALVEANVANDKLVLHFCSETYNRMPIDLENLQEMIKSLKGPTLVVVSDLMDFSYAQFVNHYKKVVGYMGSDFTEYLQNYDHEYSKWSNSRAVASKSSEKIKTSTGKKANGEVVETYDQRMMQWDNSNPSPFLDFPSEWKIDHQKGKPSSSGVSIFIPSTNKQDQRSTSEKWNAIPVPDFLKVLLLAGVGVYNIKLPQQYTDLVIDCMREGKLVYIITDPDISYGMNYPIENIIITDVMLTRSIQTFVQLCARAGRPGKSDKAKIWVDPAVLAKFTEYFITDNFDDIELKNLHKAVTDALLEIDERNQKGIRGLLKPVIRVSGACRVSGASRVSGADLVGGTSRVDGGSLVGGAELVGGDSVSKVSSRKNWSNLAARFCDMVKRRIQGKSIEITHLNIWDDNDKRGIDGKRLYTEGVVTDFPKIKMYFQKFQKLLGVIGATLETEGELLEDISLALLISVCRLAKTTHFNEEHYLQNYYSELKEKLEVSPDNNIIREKVNYIQKVLEIRV